MGAVDELILAIKRRQTPAARAAHRAIRAALEFDVPDNAVTHRLYAAFARSFDAAVGARELAGSKFLWAPMLRARCVNAGVALNVSNAPYIRSHAKIRIGDHCSFSGVSIYSGRFRDAPELTFGDHCQVGGGTVFVVNERISIGHHVHIAGRVAIQDSDGHPLDLERRMRNDVLRGGEIAPVTIGDHVWIGRDSHILKGVTIGRGAIVATGSVVASDVPEGAMAMGVPARMIRL